MSILQDADDIFIQGLRNWKVKDAGGNGDNSLSSGMAGRGYFTSCAVCRRNGR